MTIFKQHEAFRRPGAQAHGFVHKAMLASVLAAASFTGCRAPLSETGYSKKEQFMPHFRESTMAEGLLPDKTVIRPLESYIYANQSLGAWWGRNVGKPQLLSGLLMGIVTLPVIPAEIIPNVFADLAELFTFKGNAEPFLFRAPQEEETKTP